MARGLFTILLIIITTYDGFGQPDAYHFSGTVMDVSDDAPLPFVSISIQQKSSSTISNLSGEFDFFTENISTEDTLIFSMLGYRNLKVPIKELKDNPRSSFFLIPKKKFLNEVTISDTLSAKDIMKIAISKIEHNYPSSRFMLEGFYREVAMENGKYISLLEAAVNIFDKHYKSPKKAYALAEKIGIIEIRKSYNYQKYFDKKDKGKNFLSLLLQDNVVRYPSHRGCFGAFEPILTIPEQLHFEREEDTYFNDERVYVIKASPSIKGHKYDPHFYKVFINASDYGFLRIDILGKAKDKIIHEDPFLQKASLQMLYVNNTLRFKKHHGKYFLNYMKANWGFQAVDRKTQKIIDVFEHRKELMINDIIDRKARKSMLGATMKKEEKLDRQIGKYNPEFWDSYNILKLNPLEKKVVQDLEKKASLEKQFISKSSRKD